MFNLRSSYGKILVDAIAYDCPVPMMMLKKALRLNPGKIIVFKMGQHRPASDLRKFLDQEGISGKIESTNYGTYAEIQA